jgi:ribosomal subunit interface protein
MEKHITFKNMTHSQVMKDYADQQLAKVEKFLDNEPSPVFMELVFEPSKNNKDHHLVELRVKSPDYDLISHREGPDLYKLLDRVIDTMYHELHEAKRRRIDDRKQIGRHEEFKKQR